MKTINKILNNKITPVLLYIVVIAFIHIFGYSRYGDDLLVTRTLRPDLWEEISGILGLYSEWSSRLIVNAFIMVMMHFDYRIWLILDVFMMYIIYKQIVYLCFDEDTVQSRYITAGVLMLFPMEVAVEVGWVVTSMSYIWPAAAAFVACRIIKMSYKEINIKWYQCVLAVICTVFATNKEEISVMFVIIFGWALVCLIKSKKTYLIVGMQFVLSAVAVVFHAITPGNQVRYDKLSYETAINYTFIDKIEMGFSGTVRRLFLQNNYMLFFLLLVMMVYIYMFSPDKRDRYVITIPFVMWCTVGVLCGSILDYLIQSEEYIRLFGFEKTISDGKYYSVMPCFLFVVFAIYATTIFFSVYRIVQETKTTINICVLLMAGFAGRMVQGFANVDSTPFLRTYTFLYFSIVFVISYFLNMAFERSEGEYKKMWHVILASMYFIGVGHNVLLLV